MRDLLTTPRDTIEADFAALQTTLSRSPVVETRAEPDATVYWSRVPLPACNVIANARIASEDVARRVPELLAPFLERGLPFQWLTTPDTTSPALEATLAQLAFTPHESPAMHVTLEEPLDPATNDDVYIDLAWPNQVEAVAATILAGLGGPQRPGPELLRFLDGLDPEIDLAFVARSLTTGEALGASTAHRRGDSVMLAHVTTLPPARGRGVGRALAATMMNRARETGGLTATVIASQATYPFYVDLGMRTGFNLVSWLWQPTP